MTERSGKIQRLGENKRFKEIANVAFLQTEKYGCYDRHIQDSYPGRAGYSVEEREVNGEEMFVLIPVMISILNVMSRDCKHTVTNPDDIKCLGCCNQVTK